MIQGKWKCECFRKNKYAKIQFKYSYKYKQKYLDKYSKIQKNSHLLPWKWLSRNLNSLLCCWVRSGKSMKNLQKSNMKILDILRGMMRCLWNISFVVHGYLVSYVKVLFQSFPIGRMCCCCTSQPLFWSQNTIVGTETDPKIANCNYFRSIRALCILPVSPQLILSQTNWIVND